jgi:hypothetical protein
VAKNKQVSSNWKQFLEKEAKGKQSCSEFVAIDCEFVKSGEEECLARVSLVN